MTGPDRRAELIAAAVDGSLSPSEAAEFHLLRTSDPAVDPEVAELRAVVARSSAIEGWDATTPSQSLRDRIVAIGAHSEAAGSSPEAPARRRRTPVVLAAAACLLLGATVGGIVGAVGARAPAPADGPPGTLGAVEQVEFDGAPGGSEIDGAVVAHTWGTETVLHIDGLEAARRYSVVLIGTGGDRFESGTFLGSSVSIDCRMNAAVLREDVAIVEIEDADGDVIAQAALPDAS